MLLKDLILNNPELSLVVLRFNDDSCDLYRVWDVFEDPEGEIKEIFQHDDFPDEIFFDYEELTTAIYENSFHRLSAEELKAEVAKYAPYWKKCIVLEI